MRQNNTGMKVVLVVLVIVCIFQAMSLSSMREDLDVLRGEVDTLVRSLRDVRYELSQISNSQNQDKEAMDVTWGIEDIDWQNRTYTVTFAAKVTDTTDGARVVINNGVESLELNKENNIFSGKMEYSIDSKSYETHAYLYYGDYEEACQYVGDVGMKHLAAKFFMYDFYGYSAYGNDKLTLAGRVAYQVNLEEKVASMKLVFGEEEQILGIDTTGEEEVNVSIPIDVPTSQVGVEIKEVYLEVVTESGILFKVHPSLYKMYSYEMGVDEESEMISLDQSGRLSVTLPDGTTYELNIYY